MIKKATLEDKEKVYHLWKSVFAFDDGGSIDYYFNHIYQDNNCFVIKNKEGIISTLCYNKHSLFLNGKRLKASFICGVATSYSYRHQGYMHRLMQEVLDELAQQELITFIQAYSPGLYKKYGFEMIYTRKKYHLQPSQVIRCSLSGIEHTFTDEELVTLYNKFTSLFDGYYIRDIDYYRNFRNELNAESGRMITYRNEEGILEGYMVYYTANNEVRIEEIQYLNSLAFIKLLNYAFEINTDVTLFVSEREAIEMIVSDVYPERVGLMMARVNDYELFNKLYSVNVSSVQEAFDISNKPLFIRETW